MGDYVYKFWHLVDETLNAILFILIGLEIIPVFAEFQANYLVIMAIVVALVVLALDWRYSAHWIIVFEKDF